MVGRELGHRWKEALWQQRQVDEEFERWRRLAPARLSVGAARRSARWPRTCRRCGGRGATTPADRQRIARPLLERVVVTVNKASEYVKVELHWAGGLVRRHALASPQLRQPIAGAIEADLDSNQPAKLCRRSTHRLRRNGRARLYHHYSRKIMLRLKGQLRAW